MKPKKNYQFTILKELGQSETRSNGIILSNISFECLVEEAKK